MTVSFLVPKERTTNMAKEIEQLKAIGYCRVASKGEDTDNKLIEQEIAVGNYMMSHDLGFADCFYEIGRAGEALNKAYRFCKAHRDIAYLVVSNYSRLARNANEGAAWVMKFQKIGVEILEVPQYYAPQPVKERG